MLKKNWIYIVIAIGLLAFWWMRYKTVPSIDVSSIAIQIDSQSPSVSLSKVITRPSVVHYYASWCGPCMRELPLVVDFASAHPEFDVLFISDDPWTKIEALKQKASLSNLWYYHVNSLKEIGIYSIPVSYFTNEKGQIVFSNLGETEWQSDYFLQELQQHY